MPFSFPLAVAVKFPPQLTEIGYEINVSIRRVEQLGWRWVRVLERFGMRGGGGSGVRGV